eukprot:jgi/Psemu1/9294/gm1.9294_g
MSAFRSNNMEFNNIFLRGASRDNPDRVPLDVVKYRLHSDPRTISTEVLEFGEESASTEGSQPIQHETLGLIISMSTFLVAIVMFFSFYGVAYSRIQRKELMEEDEALDVSRSRHSTTEAVEGCRSFKTEENRDNTQKSDSSDSTKSETFYGGDQPPTSDEYSSKAINEATGEAQTIIGTP